MCDESRYVAIITQKHTDSFYGELTTSTAVIGALVQLDGETYSAFKDRVAAKVKVLKEAKNERGMSRHYGVEATTHRIIEEDDF